MALSRRGVLASAVSAAGYLALADSVRAQGTRGLPGFGASRDEPILGFDCASYPGDDAITTLREKHRLRVCCLYLAHCPKDPDKHWPPKREFLQLRGWGFLPTYVGAQTQGPCTMKISDPQGMGREHGNEAAKLMHDAGFQTGSVVYLDIEDPKDPDSPYGDYVRAWMKAVRNRHYYPGVFGSYYMVDWLRKLTSAIWTCELAHGARAVEAELKAIGRQNPEIEGELTNWSSAIMEKLFRMGALGYDPTKYPHGIIRPGCIGTQYKHHNTFGDDPVLKGWQCDMNFLKAADPSDPASIAQALNVTHLI